MSSRRSRVTAPPAIALLLVLASGGSARAAYAGRVEAWVPAGGGGPLIRVPVPGVWVSIDGLPPTATDPGGRFRAEGAGGARQARVSLAGPGIEVVSARGIPLDIRAAVRPAIPRRIVFPRAWAAAAAAFVHAEEARSRLAAIPAMPRVLQPPIPLQVVADGPEACDMGYDPGTGRIFFPEPAPSCPAPTERTVVYHEVVHAFMAEIYGRLEPRDLQEGLADAGAALLAGAPRIGPGVEGPGTWLREVETDAVHPVAGNAHERGLALAGAFWDLRTRLLHAHGADGAAIALRLWYEAARRLPRALGPEAARAVLDADAAGAARTGELPNEEAIREAFAAHGLLEPPPGMPRVEGLRYAVEGRTVALAWEAPARTFERIRVERDGGAAGLLPGDAAGFEDRGLPAGAHTYLVRGEGGPAAAIWVPVRTFRRGDADDDGAVAAGDALRILEYLFRGAPLDCPDAADVDDDGAVRLNDPVALLAALYGHGASPPAPFVAFGEDPTEDGLGCGVP